MAKNYLEDNEKYGLKSSNLRTGQDRDLKEAQNDKEFTKTVVEDGGTVVETAVVIGGAVATGGASAGATAGGAAAGGAAAGAGTGVAAGGTAAAGASGAGAVTGGAGAAGVGATAGAEGTAATVAGEGAVAGDGANALAQAGDGVGSVQSKTPLDNPAGDAEKLVDGKPNAGEGTDGKSVDLDSLSPEEKSKGGSSEGDQKKLKDSVDKAKDGMDKAKNSKKDLEKEGEFYKSKNPVDKDARAARKRLAQQKIDAPGNDDRGVMERSQDKQTAATGMGSALDVAGNATDVAGRGAGTVIDEATGMDSKESLGKMGSKATDATERLGKATERRLTRQIKIIFKGTVATATVATMVPLAIIMGLTGLGATTAAVSAVSVGTDSCVVPAQSNVGMNAVMGTLDPTLKSNGFAWADLSDTKKFNASNVVLAAAEMNLPPRAAVVALATVMQESGIENVDHGDTAGPDSRGMYQQRDSWGTRADRLNPLKSSKLFYERLVNVSGWEGMPITEAAQAVQISGLPNAYAKHEPDARNVAANVVNPANPHLSILSGHEAWMKGLATYVGASTSGLDGDKECDSLPVYPVGTWLNPFCENFVININGYFGPRGKVDGTSHTGTNYHAGIDLAANGGGRNPTLCAMAAGTVVRAEYAGGWGNLVQVRTDDGISYLYGHMRGSALVSVGDTVQAGQNLGVMGTTGNSNGEHLHLEIKKQSDDGIERGTTNPMCLFKTQEHIKMTSTSKRYDPSFDYSCEQRSDLDGWR